MGGQTERAQVLWLLLFVSLVCKTVEFELSDEDWEDLPASLVSLHRLRGLHDQITHEAKPDTHLPLFRAAMFQRSYGPAIRQLSDSESVPQDKNTEEDIFEVLKDCQDLPQCLLQKEQDFKGFLVHVEGQKLQDSLLSASEWSYNYRNKVLLLMDEKAETLQRAEDEYQEDPLNSMKDSRLVLVGHGKKGSDKETRLAGYQAEEVGEIVSRMKRLGGEIKTISVVACEVGSDESFITKLLNELHARSVHTELHLRSSVLQVSQSGEKVTLEITPSGLEVMRHKDDSKKVIAWRREDGKTTIKSLSNSKGKEVFQMRKTFWVAVSNKTPQLNQRDLSIKMYASPRLMSWRNWHGPFLEIEM
ncbi:hypothetical protein AALO_G00290060 [Alosa alosa]|uniref:Peptidase C80 domain-containing protein n=1 Tax=Alosa alosa TaxID=278164 RepID=A0AAV6FGJ1_9TELE|nr:hypothetical protein AALO_G00290060 [Alosa alosa]